LTYQSNGTQLALTKSECVTVVTTWVIDLLGSASRTTRGIDSRPGYMAKSWMPSSAMMLAIASARRKNGVESSEF
jgi:hypothetical protein